MKKLGIIAGALALAGLAVPAAHSSAPPSCFGKTATYVGTSGDDIIYAGVENDVIYARGGNDTVYVQDDDQATATYLCLGDGNDTVRGAHFKINGGSGYDRATVNVCWAEYPDTSIGQPQIYKVESITLTQCPMTR